MREEFLTDEARSREVYLNEGHRLAFANRVDEALEAYRKATISDPTAAEPRFQMGALYEQQGKLNESIQSSLNGISASKALLDHNPHNNELVTSLKLSNEFSRIARCHLQLGNHLEAHKYFRESLMRFDSRNAREALHHLESTYFTEKITRGIGDGPVKDDKELLDRVRGLPFLVKDTQIGRGLFATKSFAQGEVLFKEPALSCIPDLDNDEHVMCWNCLRSLEDTQFGFRSKEIEDISSQMPPEQFEGLKSEISAALEIPPLKVCQDSQGNHYCSSECRDEASRNFQKVLAEKIPVGSPQHRMLLPTHYSSEFNVEEAEKEGQIAFLKELSTVEMVTRLLAVVHENPSERFHLDRIVYRKLEPQPLLLEHQEMQLEALREVFPKFKDDLLTVEGYLRVKGLVELNTFSIETHALRIEMGETDNPEAKPDASQVPEGADEASAQQLGLHLLMRDDVQNKGHGLFRLGSLMNHSCDPNVGMAQPALNSKASWIALRDIMIGEELFDSYVALEDEAQHNRKQRREILHENYYFWCECSLCKSGK
jgi:tetratricopeptide (TPR) repeat protein